MKERDSVDCCVSDEVISLGREGEGEGEGEEVKREERSLD